MANVGQTLVRFAGALLLAAGATLVDHPGLRGRPAVSRADTATVLVAPQGPANGLQVRITQGKRAYGIRIENDMASLGDAIQPDSRVDVMVVIADASGKRVPKIFMTNMRVLAIGSHAQRTPDGRVTSALVATIEVTPDQAEKLAIAAAQGQLRLVPRSGSASSAHRQVTPRPGPVRP